MGRQITDRYQRLQLLKTVYNQDKHHAILQMCMVILTLVGMRH